MCMCAPLLILTCITPPPLPLAIAVYARRCSTSSGDSPSWLSKPTPGFDGMSVSKDTHKSQLSARVAADILRRYASHMAHDDSLRAGAASGAEAGACLPTGAVNWARSAIVVYSVSTPFFLGVPLAPAFFMLQDAWCAPQPPAAGSLCSLLGCPWLVVVAAVVAVVSRMRAVTTTTTTMTTRAARGAATATRGTPSTMGTASSTRGGLAAAAPLPPPRHVCVISGPVKVRTRPVIVCWRVVARRLLQQTACLLAARPLQHRLLSSSRAACSWVSPWASVVAAASRSSSHRRHWLTSAPVGARRCRASPWALVVAPASCSSYRRHWLTWAPVGAHSSRAAPWASVVAAHLGSRSTRLSQPSS